MVHCACKSDRESILGTVSSWQAGSFDQLAQLRRKSASKKWCALAASETRVRSGQGSEFERWLSHWLLSTRSSPAFAMDECGAVVFLSELVSVHVPEL